MNSESIIRKLVSIPAVSGFEKELGMSKLIFSFFSFFERKIDACGNVIIKLSSGKTKIVIDAHLDEVGFGIKNNKFFAIGDVDKKELARLTKIDRKLKIAYFKRKFICSGDLIRSPALDNKAGCAVAILAAEQLSKLDADIYLCFTVQEETTGKGIKAILESIAPDFLICLDSAYAKPFRKRNCDIPEISKGPAIQFKGKNFVSDKISLVCDVAEKAEIPTQFEIVDSDMGATNLTYVEGDFSKIQINVPVKFQHTAISECSLKDIENTAKLLSLVTRSLSLER